MGGYTCFTAFWIGGAAGLSGGPPVIITPPFRIDVSTGKTFAEVSTDKAFAETSGGRTFIDVE